MLRSAWLGVDRHGDGWHTAAAVSFTTVSLVFIGRVALVVSQHLRHARRGSRRAPQA